jgi:hypothetical protein
MIFRTGVGERSLHRVRLDRFRPVSPIGAESIGTLRGFGRPDRASLVEMRIGDLCYALEFLAWAEGNREPEDCTALRTASPTSWNMPAHHALWRLLKSFDVLNDRSKRGPCS